MRFDVPLPGKSTNATFELSPDGRYLAMAAREGRHDQLWIRAMDSAEARAIPGTDGARYPFWSPDGAYIGFFADGKLKKVALAGGSPQVLCDGYDGAGGPGHAPGTV